MALAGRIASSFLISLNKIRKKKQSQITNYLVMIASEPGKAKLKCDLTSGLTTLMILS